ncbi:hypothetical protein CJ179_36570 [Rhodococcus sp. ACS1]|uniref:DUF2510 domain-containing protein n=1 Tax=Rhodococcus sp. ACS1 TaxID=2028570 RepID=UPI000BB1240B|nr:DUF2510 domain-containing protein [Rhodococcus sp. ACS1]PBC39532.1 hypothetical protein CJ179_36570 [Rhodococcus sp. ACS1]
MTTPTPPVGWNPDPDGKPHLRWWDGKQWTSATKALPRTATPDGPGWFPLPSNPKIEHYWDGEKFTEQRTVAATTEQRSKGSKGKVALAVAAVAVAALAVTLYARGDAEDDKSANAPTSSAAGTTISSVITSPTTSPVSTPVVPITTPARTSATNQAVDAMLVEVLDAEGIRYSSKAAIVDLAEGVCNDFGRGANYADEVAGVTIGSNGAYDLADASFIVGAAVAGYCPQFESALPGR